MTQSIQEVLVSQQRAIEDYNDQQRADGMTTQSDIVEHDHAITPHNETAISMTTQSIQEDLNVTAVLVSQQRVIEDYNNQRQADGMTTQSDIGSTLQTNNVNNNIPSTTLTNQQPSAINIGFNENINFQSLISRFEETVEQPNSQRTQQQPQSNIGVIPENINIVLGNQQRADEYYNHQQQADRPVTISDIVSIPQTNNANDNIPSATNQRSPVFEQNSQVAEQQTMSMITEPSIHGIEEIMSVASDNIHTEALMDQQQEIFEQDGSQDSQQHGLSMTTQPDSSQESTDIAGENNNSSDPLTDRIWSLDEKVNKWIQKSSETGWQLRRRRSNTLAMQESVDVALQNLHEIINGTTNTIQPTELVKIIPQRQLARPLKKSSSVSTLGASVTSSTSAVSSNQKSHVSITPLTVTQTGDLLGPTERRRLVINSSFFMKTEQHLVWKGSIECRKKRNGSQVTQPLNCRIYGLKTESGNINV